MQGRAVENIPSYSLVGGRGGKEGGRVGGKLTLIAGWIHTRARRHRQTNTHTQIHTRRRIAWLLFVICPSSRLFFDLTDRKCWSSGGVVPGGGEAVPGDGGVVPGGREAIPGDGGVVPGGAGAIPGQGRRKHGPGSGNSLVKFKGNRRISIRKTWQIPTEIEHLCNNREKYNFII